MASKLHLFRSPLTRQKVGGCCGTSSSSYNRSQCRSTSSSVPLKTPLPKTIQRLKHLSEPKPSWGWRKEESAIALTNSQLRKAAFTSQDAERLSILRTQLREHSSSITGLGFRRRQISNAILELIKEVEKLPVGEEKTKKQTILNGLKAEGGEIKMKLKDVSNIVESVNSEAQQIRLKMPNLTHPYTPIGSILNANLVGFGGNLELLPEPMRNILEQPEAIGQKLQDLTELEQGEPDAERDHLSLAQQHGWVDNAACITVAGSSWPYMMGPLASLEVALTNYAMDIAIKHKFTPVVVPDVVKRDILGRAGFSPREAEAGQVYWIHADGSSKRNVTDDRDLALSGTAEITLGGLCAGSAYDSNSLPIQLVASSHAFRAEAGARGQDSRGLYRVHQFTKVEMFVVSRQTESEKWLDRLRDVQEEIIGGLGIPYRVLDMPTEELGASAYRKYDIEAWMPGRGSWGEISSASNCTEYQSRRLFIRYRPDKSDLFELSTNGTPDSGEAQRDSMSFLQKSRMDAGEGFFWAHTLNATAVAVPRMIVALLENYGLSKTSDKIRLPITLKKYWIRSDVDSVEWFGKEVQGFGQPTSNNSNSNSIETNQKKSLFKRSLDSVRHLAERSGTDPASMVMSFMILHELTAILPLIVLFYLLSLLGIGGSVMEWLLNASEVDVNQSSGIITSLRSTLREYMQEGMLRAERYGRKKGWFGFEKGSQMSDVEIDGITNIGSNLAGTFANAVAAYAIVKALLPVRLAACVALAGPFARVTIEPIKRLIRKSGKKV